MTRSRPYIRAYDRNARSSADAARRLVWPLRLTFAGYAGGAPVRAFWPLWSVILIALAALMLGSAGCVCRWKSSGPSPCCRFSAPSWRCLSASAAFAGPRRPRRWTGSTARCRAARSPRSPITQAIGAGDAASRGGLERPCRPDGRTRCTPPARSSPICKCPSATPMRCAMWPLLAFVMALIVRFVCALRRVTDLAPGVTGPYAGGPTWEGWVEPPIYTGQPILYLTDVTQDNLAVPAGSRITLRFYGEVGALTVARNRLWSDRRDVPACRRSLAGFHREPIRDTSHRRRRWPSVADRDGARRAPSVQPDGEVERGVNGEMRLPFTAQDDYSVVAGSARIELDLVSSRPPLWPGGRSRTARADRAGPADDRSRGDRTRLFRDR